MTSSIWEVSTRAMGMAFAYGLRDFAKCSSRVFRIRLVFAKLVFRFEGGLGIGGISKCTKPAFRLWFARVGIFIDRHFYRKRPPIQMIQMSGPIWGGIFLSFNGGSKYGEFLWGVGPCIRLWFALSGVLVD